MTDSDETSSILSVELGSSPKCTSSSCSSEEDSSSTEEASVVESEGHVDRYLQETNGKEFKPSTDVLVHWSDGLFYLGVIVQVEESHRSCLIKFEDKSHFWCSFQHIQKAAMPGADIFCLICSGGRSQAPNQIVLCDNCNHGYHQNCHKPKIPQKVLRPNVPWLCRNCRFATVARNGGAQRKGTAARALQVVKKVLPYEIGKLTWDNLHQVNREELYCYCGGPGEWNVKMLQCRRCQQWFHEACLQCLEFPLVFGDHMFVFVCGLCNFGEEFLERLSLTWGDVCHILLYGLRVIHRKKLFDIDSEILPNLNANWCCLQLPYNIHKTPESERRLHVIKALSSDPIRFKCGTEEKKRNLLYSLKKPDQVLLPPIITLPRGLCVTKELVLSSLKAIPTSRDLYLKKELKKNGISENGMKRRHFKPAKATVSKGEISAQSSCSSSLTSMQENNDSEDTSSIGTLDSFIPKPSNFEGMNHPFRIWEQKTKKAKKNHSTSLSSLSMSSQGRNRDPIRGSQRATASMKHSENIVKLVDNKTNNKEKRETGKKVSRFSKNSLGVQHNTYTPRNLSLRGRDIEAEGEGTSCMEKRIVSPVMTTKIPNHDPKQSVNSFFAATNRIARGEKINILAKRIDHSGRLQYLIEWEGVS